MKRILEFINNLIFNSNNSWLVIALIMLPSLNVLGIEAIPYVDPIMTLLIYGIFFVLLVLFIYEKRKPSLLLVLLGVMNVLIFINTFIHGDIDNTLSVLKYVLSGLSIALIIESAKDNYENLIKGLMVLFEILIYINFAILIYKLPEGTYFAKAYLFGHYNNSIYYFICALLISYLYYQLTKKYKRAICLASIIVISMFINDSSTGKACAIAVALYIGLDYLFNKITKGKEYLQR